MAAALVHRDRDGIDDPARLDAVLSGASPRNSEGSPSAARLALGADPRCFVDANSDAVPW